MVGYAQPFHGITETVGAESISARSFDVQSVDVSKTRANSKARADMESAPTGINAVVIMDSAI